MTTTATVPAASPINLNPVVASAVQSATLPLANIWASVTGLFSSIGVGGALTVLTMFAPNSVTMIVALVAVAAAILSALAHGYAIVTGVSATNNATIVLAENFLNEVETRLGGKAFAFANDASSPLPIAQAS